MNSKIVPADSLKLIMREPKYREVTADGLLRGAGSALNVLNMDV